MFCCSLYFFTLWLREPNFRTAHSSGLGQGWRWRRNSLRCVSSRLRGAGSGDVCGFRKPQLACSSANACHCRAWRVHGVVGGLSLLSYSLTQATGLPDRVAVKVFGRSSRMTRAVHAAASHVPVPMPEFFDGIRNLRRSNHTGTRAYLFGQIRSGGWWYFFFVALALKTPIAVLLLALVGQLPSYDDTGEVGITGKSLSRLQPSR